MNDSEVNKTPKNDNSPNWGDGVAMESRPQGRGKLFLLLTGAVLVAGAIAIVALFQYLNAAREVVLDSAKQEEIWDSEHVTFKIETHFGKPFVKALKSRDNASLTEFFQPDSKGRFFANPKEQTSHVGVVSETKVGWDQQADEKADRDGIVRHLLDSINEVHEIERSKVRVLKIEPYGGTQDEWLTRLLLTCSGRSKEGQLVDFRSEHDVVFRFQEAGDDPKKPLAIQWETVSQLTRTSETPLMEDVTEAIGLDGVSLIDNWTQPISGRNPTNFDMAVADYNQDGYLDIAVAPDPSCPRDLNQPILLQSQDGNGFKDVAEAVGLKGPVATTLISFIDFNNDGYPDLLMGSRLYQNENGRNFKDVTSTSGLRIGFDGKITGCVVADYDCDGDLDLYILHERPVEKTTTEKESWVGDSLSGARNQLWRNEGDGRFRDVTEEASAHGETRHSFAATWFFYDDDHLPDIYIANDFGRNVLLHNRGDGTFDDVTTDSDSGDFSTSMGVASGDINNDGTTEVYVGNMYSKMGRRIIGNVCDEDYPPGIFEQIQGSCRGNTLYSRSPGETRFREIGETMAVNEVGWAFGTALADFNNDGWLDLYSTTGFFSVVRDKPDG